MIGLEARPESTLADRAVQLLAGGPQSALALSKEVMGLVNPPALVADRLAIALLGADPRVAQLPDGLWSIVRSARRSPRLDECAFAVVDVETTGVRASRDDRITEIAVAVVCRGQVEMVVDTLVNPGRPIPYRVTAVTRITNQMVSRAPRFSEVAEQVLAALAGRVFVAHNARFDWHFVNTEVRRARDLRLDGPLLCTVRLSRRLMRGQLRSHGLDSLTHYFGFENPARHRAGGDTLVTARILCRLLELAGERGARTFDDLATL